MNYHETGMMAIPQNVHVVFRRPSFNAALGHVASKTPGRNMSKWGTHFRRYSELLDAIGIGEIHLYNPFEKTLVPTDAVDLPPEVEETGGSDPSPHHG